MPQRILQATAASLSWQPLDGDGEPGDPGGTVTVGVVASDGSTVISSGTATSGSGSEPRAVALTAAQTADLEVFAATWKIGSTTVATTEHWVVGGFLYSIADLRNRERSLADSARDESTVLREVRDEIEETFEGATGVPWTPRLHLVTSLRDHDGYSLDTRRTHARTVRWCRLWSTESSYTELTAAELAEIAPAEDGILTLPVSTSGAWKVTAAVEVGFWQPGSAVVGSQVPADVRRQALLAARAGTNQARSGIPDRATSQQLADGGSVTLATPGVGRWITGIPTVDELLKRRDRRRAGYVI